MSNLTKQLLLVAALAGFAFVAHVGYGQESQTDQNQGTTQEVPEVSGRLSERALNVLYTKTNLQLAELELERAMLQNSRRYRLIPRLTIERMRSNVAIAKEQYEQAKMESDEGPEKVRLKHAQEKLRVAQLDLNTAEKLKAKSHISDIEFKRLELKLDLAKLKVALMQHPTGYMTLLDGMQRQLDQFGGEILALDQRVSKLEGSSLSKSLR